MTSFQERPWLLEVIAGFGTPYGLIGAALEYDFVPELGTAVGSGFTTSGPTLAAALRVRVPLRRVGLGAELAWSGGPHDAGKCLVNCYDAEHPYREYPFAHWANVAVVVERRGEGGLSLKGFIGLALPLTHGSGQCVPKDELYGSSCPDTEAVMLVGIGIGGAMRRH